MKKVLKSLLVGSSVGLLLFGKSTALAYDFDANYYARKYPDVVQSVGSDYISLYNHYMSFGIDEGRFISQQEESDYAAKGITKPKNQKVEPEVVETPSNPAVVENNNTEIKKEPEIVNVTPIAPFVTYVDVDKTNQIVTYFENGVMKMQSPCVTGNESAKHGTPCGTFSIIQHTTNKYLIGPTWKAYVSYWMKFTPDACGLHDASWRQSFGGEIYKTNGSHGCVNLPYDAAKQLYDYTSLGTTVYVHE